LIQINAAWGTVAALVATMSHGLDLLAFCGSPGAGAGLLLGLFVAGAAGSAVHCVPMCGGFVLGQVADRMARLRVDALCEWRRVATGALVPYHLGRLTTYAALGAAAGTVGGAAARLPWLGGASAVLLGVAALLFAAHALRLPGLARAPAVWGRLVARVARWGGDGYLLGVALGFLPCGFLYAALATAAAGGGAAFGAAAMLAFGLGTAPALILVGIGGYAAGQQWRRGVAVASPAVMLLNAALLAVLAVRGMAGG
jgi:uncharacterized protein